jgi:hypothetical protein
VACRDRGLMHRCVERLSAPFETLPNLCVYPCRVEAIAGRSSPRSFETDECFWTGKRSCG